MATSTRSRYHWAKANNCYRVYSTRTGALVGVVWCHQGQWHAYAIGGISHWRTGPTPTAALRNANRATSRLRTPHPTGCTCLLCPPTAHPTPAFAPATLAAIGVSTPASQRPAAVAALAARHHATPTGPVCQATVNNSW